MVHFVYRSHYDNPSSFHVRRFKADTVLEWFQSIWEGVPAEAGRKYPDQDHAKKLIGRDVYCFHNLFSKTDELGWRVPQSLTELEVRLDDALYINALQVEPHSVQVLTDDDELEMGIHIFDDHYATRHPERVAFLLHDGFALPDGGKHGGFRRPADVPELYPELMAGDGRTYFVQFAAYDGSNLRHLKPKERSGVIPGVRVGDLPRLFFALDAMTDKQKEKLHDTLREVLSGLEPAAKTAKGEERPLLKAARAEPNDTARWNAYADWCAENGKPPLLERILARYDATRSTGEKRNPKRDVIAVGRHVAQAGKHVDRWHSGRWRTELFHTTIFFDDQWANAHPQHAASLLRAAGRWDIL